MEFASGLALPSWCPLARQWDHKPCSSPNFMFLFACGLSWFVLLKHDQSPQQVSDARWTCGVYISWVALFFGYLFRPLLTSPHRSKAIKGQVRGRWPSELVALGGLGDVNPRRRVWVKLDPPGYGPQAIQGNPIYVRRVFFLPPPRTGHGTPLEPPNCRAPSQSARGSQVFLCTARSRQDVAPSTSSRQGLAGLRAARAVRTARRAVMDPPTRMAPPSSAEVLGQSSSWAESQLQEVSCRFLEVRLLGWV